MTDFLYFCKRYMKQMWNVIRILAVLCIVWLTVITNCQSKDNVSLQEYPFQSEETVMVPQQQRHHEATLTDATQLYRICSSRPQRINPTHGSKSEPSSSLCIGFAQRYVVKLPKFFHDYRLRLNTAPFRMSASRDYYVIALRHIIR